jgi:colanic acid/amylovoran biosynthesis glycosyltransferase
VKIALIVPSFPVLSETFIVNKFLGLLDRGQDVWVVCDRSDPDEWRRFPRLERSDLRRRVVVNWRKRPRWAATLLYAAALSRCAIVNPTTLFQYLVRGFRSFGFNIAKRFYVDARLIEVGPEIVHFEFGALAAKHMYLPRLLGAGSVVSFRGHDLNFVGLDDPHYYQEVWEKADRLHFLGTDLQARARDRGCPADKECEIISPAIDADLFETEDRSYEDGIGTSERPILLLSMARMHWSKGHEYALQAIRSLIDEGRPVEFRVVGDGAYLDAVAFCRHQLGLEDAVDLVGPVAPHELHSYLGWADIFVHAAVSEGFSNAVLEAQAAGLPVVCSDADGLPENVVDGITGFVVPRRDAAALADKIRILADDTSLRRSMGEAGGERVRERFQLDQQTIAFEGIYEKALRSDSSRDPPPGTWSGG